MNTLPKEVEIESKTRYTQPAWGSLVECPECEGVWVALYHCDPGSSCAGGTFILRCMSCEHLWVFYDDEA
ncbi:hypothetical protein LCGC14_3123930 [marine sediment metagenome]|uniref:Uncharacterized protein n=1 Tax=marine sediment metagenome TaxID=412755 RepID=A0A0F8W1G5_9ZZZZ